MDVSTRKTLLLVEHDLARRLRLGTAIVRRKWRMRTARSGDEALETLHWFEPAVILLDLGMHPISARELVERLREREHGARATIVGMVDREHDASGLGLDAVLARPFSFEGLFETIDLACQSRARSAANDATASRAE